MRNAFEIAERLLATGPNGGGVALLAGRATALLREGDATGLAVDANRLAWCLQGPGPTRIREFLDGSLRERRLADNDLDLHDLLGDGEGWWAVATATNAVYRIDAAGPREHRRFSDVPDSWHVNSLTRYRGALVASAFGRFATHRGYKGASTCAGEVFRVEDGERLVGGLSQPHSLLADGDTLWLCNSEAGEVLQVRNGAVAARWTLPGYTRGLALGARHAYVGLSLSRNPGAERGGQRFDSAVVAVLDRRDGRVEGYIALPWREIYDLRVLDDGGMGEALLIAQLDDAAHADIASAPTQAPAPVPVDLALLADATALRHAAVIHAISGEIHHMQATMAAAMQQLGAREESAAVVDALGARLEAVAATVDGVMADLSERLDGLPAAVEASTAGSVLTALDHAVALIVAEAADGRGVTAGLSVGLAALRGEIDQRQAALEAALNCLAPMAGALDGVRVSLERRLDEQAAAGAERATQLGLGLDALRRCLDDEGATAARASHARAEVLAGELSAALADARAWSGRFAETRDALAALEVRHAELVARHARLEDARAGLEARHAALQKVHEADGLDARHERERTMQERQEAEATIHDLRAALAERDDELHALRHEAEQLRESAQTLQQVVGSASWRWTRPLRAAARLLRGEWRADSSARLGQMVRGVVARAPGLSDDARSALIERSLLLGDGAHVPALLPDRHLAPRLALAVPDPALPDVFVWSVIDWHFRVQRPQHLARSLAGRGHRVFYISNNFVDAAEPGFHVQPLDGDGRLFQVHLDLAGAPAIYYGLPSEAQVDALHASLAALLEWTCTRASLSLVQHAYWTPLVRSPPNARVVYDCMDHHAGFDDNAPAVLQAEQALVADADLVIVTSAWLHEEIAPKARATAMVRNAGEYAHFASAPAEVFRDEQGRRVIGYYGAIAEWFDLDLVRAVARSQPEALLLLVGNDTAGAGAALADLPNVRLVGEVPYADLPYWLHGFDVALLPFKVIPLTLATNPVKVYEYLAAGKSVVVVGLPEMSQFEGLVRTAADQAGFVAAVAEALAAQGDAAAVAARQAFAAGQTWAHRARALDEALEAIAEPRASVIVLTYNNLAFTDACLFSIEAYSDYSDLEVIVVDNASSDGSREWLQRWVDEPSKAGHARRLILNDDNLGFAAGNNVGLAAATGDVLVMLNNDTYVTPGWVRGLCNHLRREPRLGLVGPVTNNIGNEAKLEIAYPDMVEMIRVAGQHTRRYAGHRHEIPTVAFFCVAMPRAVYERVGGLDEAFGVGFFEDDDYCRRVAQAGWAVACADDVFIHHHLSASFDALKADKKKELFDRNKAIYEAKWGEWVPHAYRKQNAP